MPWSRTTTRAKGASLSTVTSTGLPAPNFRALVRRFVTTCSIRSRSHVPRTGSAAVSVEGERDLAHYTLVAPIRRQPDGEVTLSGYPQRVSQGAEASLQVLGMDIAPERLFWCGCGGAGCVGLFMWLVVGWNHGESLRYRPARLCSLV